MPDFKGLYHYDVLAREAPFCSEIVQRVQQDLPQGAQDVHVLDKWRATVAL